MALHIALWIGNLVLDAQTARNAVFPEASQCPVIGLGSLAASAPPDTVPRVSTESSLPTARRCCHRVGTSSM